MAALLVYDDDCGFCSDTARWMARRGYTLIGFSELTDEQRERLPADYLECSHIIEDTEVYSCGDMVLHVAKRPSWASILAPMLSHPPFSWAVDAGYRIVARNRALVSRLTRPLRRR